ncbi:TetR family transcriptional regulator [Antricoccus suffuscus]|uniref:TetR family transcriptional regulator n=1 Tax=Antricoccus suffuscus TaxID=1629062 RepID=A0A2T0ZXH0_9ACTN|nr:TetR/AcrR family transcriptional regulator [Antricoccus suffuscus]PRZ41056.1 TetR family transcriptional regulator [Antricoccus suffuscus]
MTSSTAPKRRPRSDTEPTDSRATKADRTRERLITAAAAILSTKGYAGTRLSDIAAEAQMQAPAIYYHFASREDLIQEVLVEGTIRLRDHVEQRLAACPDGTPAIDRIDVAIEAHLTGLMSGTGFAHSVIRNQSQLPPDMRSRQLVEERKYAATWRNLFEEAHSEGSLRDNIDPQLARLLIIGALNWATEWWSPARGSLEAVIETAQAMAHSGIAKRRRRSRPATKR